MSEHQQKIQTFYLCNYINIQYYYFFNNEYNVKNKIFKNSFRL